MPDNCTPLHAKAIYYSLQHSTPVRWLEFLHYTNKMRVIKTEGIQECVHASVSMSSRKCDGTDLHYNNFVPGQIIYEGSVK